MKAYEIARKTTMNDRDQIIAWAREAGFDICGASGQRPNEVTVEDFICTEEIERLVRIVAAHEREQCARVCDDLPAPQSCNGVERSLWDVATLDCAAAIRGRAEK